MRNPCIPFLLLLISAFVCSCNSSEYRHIEARVRPLADTTGFAHLSRQTDSVMNRINRTFSGELSAVEINPDSCWKAAICPHDDYTYAGWQYPAILKNIKAKTVIIFGVAHKAKQFNIADRIVFDSYPFWHGPYKNIRVSRFREEIIARMPQAWYQVSDSLQRTEHSAESMLPFLQYFNRDVEIIPILVPYMDAGRTEEISKSLAQAISVLMKKHHLKWGKDMALLITTDAVHYGDEDWGGKNMAPYGTGSSGYAKAVRHEHAIIDSCLTGKLSKEKILRFIGYTVQPGDYKEYKWTWCGRYSIPLGLMTALFLSDELNSAPPSGRFLAYTTSIDHALLPVEDLGMGKTAIASLRHWVGYVSVGYK